jgi:hypothetical protein
MEQRPLALVTGASSGITKVLPEKVSAAMHGTTSKPGSGAG